MEKLPHEGYLTANDSTRFHKGLDLGHVLSACQGHIFSFKQNAFPGMDE